MFGGLVLVHVMPKFKSRVGAMVHFVRCKPRVSQCLTIFDLEAHFLRWRAINAVRKIQDGPKQA